MYETTEIKSYILIQKFVHFVDLCCITHLEYHLGATLLHYFHFFL